MQAQVRLRTLAEMLVRLLAESAGSAIRTASVASFVDEWANTASVLGLLVALVGFAVTIGVALRSRAMAKEARDAIFKFDATVAFGEAIATIEEVRRLHRAEAWTILPDRYLTARKLLVAVRATDGMMTEDQKATLTNAITHLAEIERQVEKTLSTKAGPPSSTRINKVLAEDVEQLSEIHAVIRQEA